MLFPIRAAAAALAAVALAPAAAHAQQQYTVGFNWEPKAPTTLDDVTLSATTVGGLGTPVVTWDFDGDGTTDATGQTVKHRFAVAGDYRTIVKATWSSTVAIVRQDVESITVKPANAEPTPQPTVAPVPTVMAPAPTPTPTPAPESCQSTVLAGKLSAASWCFKKSAIPGGSRYTSTFPINVNGIGVGPTGGKPVTIDVTDHVAVNADNAHVYFRTKNTTVQAYTGKVAWKVVDDRLTGFAFSNAAIGGMRITGLPELPLLKPGGASHMGIYLALPAKLGGGTSSSPVALDLGGANASSLGAFAFKVPVGSLPGLNLRDLTVSYDGDGLWDIAGGVGLPNPTPLNINGDIGVRNGVFEHLQASASYGNGGPQLGPITLRRISFRVELLPKVSQCVPKIGKETIDIAKLVLQATGIHVNAPPVVIDHGKPVLALCGDVSLTAGPKLLGAAAIGIDGHLGFAVFDDRPAVFHAMGSVTLARMPLPHAGPGGPHNGYIYAHGDFCLGWKGIASLKGFATLEMKAPKFNAEASVSACLEFVKFCAGAHALVSSKGVVACLNIDTFLGDWHPGFGDKWGSAPKLYFAGCDVGPYRDAIAASAAGTTRSVRIGPGLPGATILVTGKGAPPPGAFVGPHGERIETPADLQPLGGKGSFLVKSPAENITEIALAKPSAGTWRVEVLPGSAPVTRVESAEGLPAPNVHATVRGHVLRYSVVTRPGQVVRFSEHGASAGGAIGTAHGAHGTLRFTPADGKAERREIVALVEQDGALRARIVVGHYRAPAPKRPAAVRGLKVHRSRPRIVASWHGRGADVRVALSDGRRLDLRARGTSVTVPRVARGTHATITVRVLSASGLPGRPATAKVR